MWDEEKLLLVIDELGERAEETGFSSEEIEMLNASIDDLVDNDFLDGELAGIEPTFNLSLTFDRTDREELLDYVTEYGKTGLVKLIMEKVKEEII
jgi:hypothetical protein